MAHIFQVVRFEVYAVIMFSIQATCPTQLIFLYLITLIVSGEVHKLLSSSLCIILKSPITSYIASTNYEVAHIASSSSPPLFLYCKYCINILLCTLPHTPPNYVVLITVIHQVRT
jgi:hypothetical protein